MGFGAIVKYHYEGGKKYQFLQKPVMFVATVPINIRKMIVNRSFNLNEPLKSKKHKDKNRFEQFIENSRNALLVIPL